MDTSPTVPLKSQHHLGSPIPSPRLEGGTGTPPETEPHYKIRLILRGGGMIHLASRTEPWWEEAQFVIGGELTDPYLEWDPIEGPGYGDTLGHINWREVAAISWRWHP